ncbi:MAG: hypothetical protein WC517_03755 [Patescibacteria group bacterium]
MKVHICDVCFYESGLKELKEASIRIGRKDQNGRIVIDVCEKHKDFLKGITTYEEAFIKVMKLKGIKTGMLPEGKRK